MQQLKRLTNLTGIAVLLISFIVYYFSVERTGSLWDCGEFILGAYKLQVVHPPGAGLFLLIGRMFAWVADIVSDDPADIAFAVNLLSALCTSVAAMLTAWITILLGKIALVGRTEVTNFGQNVALSFAGLSAGLAAAFSTSIWFSAVEGEVYAMSTMFTALTVWSAVKYYVEEDADYANRWLVFSLFSGGLSVGVHLLSILTYPAIALMVYFKNYKNHNLKGALISMIAGVGAIIFVMKIVIVGIPTLWQKLELFMVNSLGMPFHSGLIPTILIVGAIAYFVLKYANTKGNQLLQTMAVAAVLTTVAFSVIGVVVIRANADTPVNMNVPGDAMRLLPYLNREQYGERALVRGPHYDARPKDLKRTDRYGRVGKKYVITDEKFDYIYDNKDKMLFPRIGHSEQGRPELHKMWRETLNGSSKGTPGMGYNLQFLLHYQINWMYVRYFMWNFVGKQNGEQGYYPWDKRSGHWLSGIKPIDEARLYKEDNLPETMKFDQARNTYYFLPLIFGILGMIFHFMKRKKDFATLFVLFIITGIGIIIYSNQPPNEPRERDYVLVGSFMTFCIWIGMGVLALYKVLSDKISTVPASFIAGLLVLSAPLIMGFQNFDDHSRKEHYASRDYASNFLNSVRPNSIIFTYGDNDTYPLWYAQEVEGIRRDVRVVNLSLIAVDWYINKLRNKVNDSAPIKLSLSEDDYRGKNRNQIFFANPDGEDLNRPINIFESFRMMKDPRYTYKGQTFVTSKKFFLPVDREKYLAMGIQTNIDSSEWAQFIEFNFPESAEYITKDDLAVMDVIASNFYDRPIYFAITCQAGKLLGLNNYVEMEGLGLRISPTKVRVKSQLPSIYGYGDIDADVTYENIMTKWKWGNFDKKRLFVDRSYMAEVQAMKLTMLRAAIELDRMGDKKRAGDMAKKYFEAFPHMNFPYDSGIMPFINVLVNTNDYDEVKKQLRILAEETRQYINFYDSQTNNDIVLNFRQDYDYRLTAARDIIEVAGKVEDPAFLKEMEEIVGPILANN
ncbi:MAG: DUF2723 domain-containing protein [Saprospiraceae bacterium]|nr:DUF2723 domain-containing protein [Saprospiraceae bacterium]